MTNVVRTTDSLSRGGPATNAETWRTVGNDALRSTPWWGLAPRLSASANLVDNGATKTIGPTAYFPVAPGTHMALFAQRDWASDC